ncbi:MAG: type II secretion system protein [Gammaproteobacteria bacterium]|nr:type II secretion system protein [Gammaproteobacteria bacterium]
MSMPNKQQGFTLIELIIGIVVFAVAMTMMTSLIFPQVQRSIDPIYQIRATELANTLINEIQAKPFDENSTPWLGLGRCDETDPPLCTLAGDLGPDNGPDNETRDLFDDVDDYHQLNISGQHLYQNFALNVVVFYDSDFNGIEDSDITSRGAKLIQVTVTTPSGQTIKFATYRSNY